MCEFELFLIEEKKWRESLGGIAPLVFYYLLPLPSTMSTAAEQGSDAAAKDPDAARRIAELEATTVELTQRLLETERRLAHSSQPQQAADKLPQGALELETLGYFDDLINHAASSADALRQKYDNCGGPRSSTQATLGSAAPQGAAAEAPPMSQSAGYVVPGAGAAPTHRRAPAHRLAGQPSRPRVSASRRHADDLSRLYGKPAWEVSGRPRWDDATPAIPSEAWATIPSTREWARMQKEEALRLAEAERHELVSACTCTCPHGCVHMHVSTWPCAHGRVHMAVCTCTFTGGRGRDLV